MTVLGIDISHYQAGLNLADAKAGGIDFVIAKCTEGAHSPDPTWPAFRDVAIRSGLLVAAYHYVRSDSSAAAQADNIATNLGDKAIPVMLDVENNAGSDVGLLHSIVDECAKRGIRVTLVYLPHWYWTGTMRSADLRGLPPLVASSYGANLVGAFDRLYPGDRAGGWGSYGGAPVALLQYGSRGRIPGYSADVDVMAFRGSLDELRAANLFYDPNPEDDMALSDDDIARIWAYGLAGGSDDPTSRQAGTRLGWIGTYLRGIIARLDALSKGLSAFAASQPDTVKTAIDDALAQGLVHVQVDVNTKEDPPAA